MLAVGTYLDKTCFEFDRTTYMCFSIVVSVVPLGDLTLQGSLYARQHENCLQDVTPI